MLSGRLSGLRALQRYGAEHRLAASRSLVLMGLSALMRTKVSTLSIGQQQRVLIARALASDPEVLVLDEPASALDADSQQALTASLTDIRKRGHAVLLVAHGLGELEALLDRVIVLEQGAVAYDGPPLLGEGRPHLHVIEAGGPAHPPHSHHHPPGEDIR